MSISSVVTSVDGTKKRVGNYAHVKANRLRNKQRLVAQFGGKCKFCGYSRSLSALHFHHINPKEKSFTIASKGKGKNFIALLEEAQKCILVCANCHHEIHDGIRKLVVPDGI